MDGGRCRIVPPVAAETFEPSYCCGVLADFQVVLVGAELCHC